MQSSATESQQASHSQNGNELTFGSLVERTHHRLVRRVHLESLGAVVYVREPTAAIEIRAQAMMAVGGRLDPDRLPESRAWRMAQCLYDSQGGRIVGDDQLDVLLSLSKRDFEELDDAIDAPATIDGALGN